MGVWRISEGCLVGGFLKGLQLVAGGWLIGVWKLSGSCLQGVCKVSGRDLETVGQVKSSKKPFDPKFSFTQNFLDLNFLDSLFFGQHIFFGPKIFQDPIYIRTTTPDSDPKIFFDQNLFCTQNFVSPNFSYSNFQLAIEPTISKLEGPSFGNRPSIYVSKGWYNETCQKQGASQTLAKAHTSVTSEPSYKLVSDSIKNENVDT